MTLLNVNVTDTNFAVKIRKGINLMRVTDFHDITKEPRFFMRNMTKTNQQPTLLDIQRLLYTRYFKQLKINW